MLCLRAAEEKTLDRHLEVACQRQGDIIRDSATPQSAVPMAADEIAEAVYKKLRESGVDMRAKMTDL